MDIQELLGQDMDNGDDTYGSRMEAIQDLEKFKNETSGNFGVGDYVERNSFGIEYYNSPKNNQAAICVRKFKAPILNKNDDLCDAEIIIATKRNTIFKYLICSDYYKKLGS